MNSTMGTLSRRELFLLGLAASTGLARAGGLVAPDVHRQILDLAARLEERRRARFAVVKTMAELEDLQGSLRRAFLLGLDGLPERAGIPAVTSTGRIEEADYSVEKLVYESLPGYLVPALLYRPKGGAGPMPAVLSPCGHSGVAKAADDYQILHINLAKRGFVVLTYDPVGQGERSQFWDLERRRTKFDLACGEHAVIGNALYLLGTNLARYRIWDGMRGIDYLASLPEVDPQRIGCVGNSGGGTLAAYITALDPRVAAVAICCYITTLPRRMANRIEEDPTSDPEQDLFGFVSEGIDHAGLLALCAPRPTLIGSARLDFFPIEGARESFSEAKKLYEVAGFGDRIAQVEAPGKHGLSLPLREAVYGWFGRWLAGVDDPAPAREVPVRPRPPEQLRVCADGQVNLSFRSRPLLPLALEEFRGRRGRARRPLRDLLRLDQGGADPRLTEITTVAGAGKVLVLCVNGNEAPDWRERRDFLRSIEAAGLSVAIVDPRGAGPARLDLKSRAGSYADPLSGVEENVAYNAFLVGQTLLGLRVADVLAAARKALDVIKPRALILCGSRDAALVACFAAAEEPAIRGVATEEMLRSYLPLFSTVGHPINAASILPGLLRDFGDLPDVLETIGPRRILVSSGIGEGARPLPSIQVVEKRFTDDPRVLTDWIRGSLE
jgi:dienelactone hydrolase